MALDPGRFVSQRLEHGRRDGRDRIAGYRLRLGLPFGCRHDQQVHRQEQQTVEPQFPRGAKCCQPWPQAVQQGRGDFGLGRRVEQGDDLQHLAVVGLYELASQRTNGAGRGLGRLVRGSPFHLQHATALKCSLRAMRSSTTAPVRQSSFMGMSRRRLSGDVARKDDPGPVADLAWQHGNQARHFHQRRPAPGIVLGKGPDQADLFPSIEQP